MRVTECVGIIFCIFLSAVAEQTNSESESSGLVLEPEEPQIKNIKETDIKLINVQKFIGEAKAAVDKAQKVLDKNNIGRDFSYKELEKFTDFIKHVIKILNNYEDGDLEQFVAIIDDEIRKFHYRGCKFYELIENDSLRRFMGKKLDDIKMMSAADIRSILTAIDAKIEKQNYTKIEKEFVDYINSLYRQDSANKFNKFLVNIDDYRLKSRRGLDLVDIIKDGVRSVIFDHYTVLNHNARIALKHKLDEFWDYMVGVSASLVMKHYLNNLKLPDSVKVFANNELSDESLQEPTTVNQVLIGRDQKQNISLDQLTNSISDRTTTKYKHRFQKVYKSHRSDRKRKHHRSNKKTTQETTTMRQMYKVHYLDVNDFPSGSKVKQKLSQVKLESKGKKSDKAHHGAKKYDTPSRVGLLADRKDTKNSNLKSINRLNEDLQEVRKKDKHSGERKNFINTEDPTTLRQMYIESRDSKLDITLNSHSTEHKNDAKNVSDNEGTTMRQMYLENIDGKYDASDDSNSASSHKKVHEVIPSKHSDKREGTEKNHKTFNMGTDLRVAKPTDETSTHRQLRVEIMNFKYKPHKNTRSTEFKSKDKSRLKNYFNTKNVQPKNILHRHNTHNFGVPLRRQNNNMYIDVNTKLVNRKHFKRKANKNRYTLRQMYLEKESERLRTTSKAKGILLHRDGGNRRGSQRANRRSLKSERENYVDNLRVGVDHTYRKPTDLEIIGHNATIKSTQKSHDLIGYEKMKHKTHFSKINGPSSVDKAISRRAKQSNKGIKLSTRSKNANVSLQATNNSKYTDPLSEEGLSIEEIKNSNRRMNDNIAPESLLNDTAVITKIKQLENELTIVKTKLNNDTEIIKTLNDKICETETKLKEFCQQEFKIVMKNKDPPDDVYTKEDTDVVEDKKLQGDTQDAYKGLQVKRSLPDENVERNSNKNIAPIDDLEKGKVLTKKQTFMHSDTLNNNSNTDNDSADNAVPRSNKTDIDTALNTHEDKISTNDGNVEKQHISSNKYKDKQSKIENSDEMLIREEKKFKQRLAEGMKKWSVIKNNKNIKSDEEFRKYKARESDTNIGATEHSFKSYKHNINKIKGPTIVADRSTNSAESKEVNVAIDRDDYSEDNDFVYYDTIIKRRIDDSKSRLKDVNIY